MACSACKGRRSSRGQIVPVNQHSARVARDATQNAAAVKATPLIKKLRFNGR